MLHFVKGDMLQSEADALVNTVNTVGVMGKGIALQFKEAFPNNTKAYVTSCKKEELAPGILLPFWEESMLLGRKLIVNFPTKEHWRNPSKYEYIEKGLQTLQTLIVEEGIKSIAIPPLGCGNGGLEWAKVKPMIEKYLGHLPIEVYVYQPNELIKEILQKQETKKEIELTPARAQLLYVLFAYESLGEYSSLFAANKLAYFLQRLGQPLKLHFKPHLYGPYAIGVEKVLYALNGVFLKGMEQGEAKPFEPLKLNYERWAQVKKYIEKEISQEDLTRLQRLIKLIQNFSSDLSLEILATTDFILQEYPSYSLDQVMNAIWTDRKKGLFKKEHVAIAYDHLKQNMSIS